MKILNEHLEIVEMDSLQVFKQSKRIIYSILSSSWFDFKDIWEDAEQECALLFFGKLEKVYDPQNGTMIWQYLKICYRNKITGFLLRQKNLRFAEDVDEEILRKKLHKIDLQNFKLETQIDLNKLLSAEQKRIVVLLLNGWHYEQICDEVLPQSNSQDKKRPIYRRMIEIKYKLARYFEINFQAPAVTTRLIGGRADEVC